MKKIFKFYIIFPIVVVLAIAALFAVWHFLPKQKLDIVVLDKTITADKIDENNNITADYRKHMGLFWILRYQRYVKADNSFYDYTTDYYGPIVATGGESTDRPLTNLTSTPDLIYLADAYGDEETATEQKSGITLEEMAAVSTAHLHGSTVVGEFNITPSKTDDPVRAELETLFGVGFSGWVGRYVVDMGDLTDVPQWVLDLHEREYGRQWDYTGSGIILASRDGELVVLQQGTDYTGALTVEITKAYQKQYGKLKVNYYNWFEIVTAEYGMDTVAQYNIPLTTEGKDKFSKVTSSGQFPAIVMNNTGIAPTYYFAGDFNDYVARERYGDFIFANTFMRIFSYDRPGDITCFYWNFFQPFMETVLETAQNNTANKTSMNSEGTAANTRIDNNQLQYYDGSEWKDFAIKGFNINAVMPGDQPYEYTRDISIYRYFLTSVSDMGGNCIRAYDLMPPEFYRALYEFNLQNPNKTICFYQSILPPDNITAGEYLSSSAMDAILENMRYTVDAVHGNATVPKIGSREGGTYINNVSPYLLGYIVEIDTDQEIIEKINTTYPAFTYSGDFVSGGAQSVPAEHLMAQLCDELFSYQSSKYSQLIPVGVLGNQELIPNSPWTQYSNGTVFDVSRLKVSDKVADNFFLSYSLQPSDRILLDNASSYTQYTDDTGIFAYGGYIAAFKALQSSYPVLIDRVGLSTNANTYEQESAVNGLSEQDQGTGLVRILTAIDAQGYMGGLISDLNDDWSACSEELEEYIIPLKNNALWHNTLDATQNTGILAVEPKAVTDIGMSLKDTERMTEANLQADEEYFYMTIMLSQETDYTKEKLIIGLDTYHRSYGEYLYDPDLFATGLSGMEYVIKFDSKENAAIYVVPDYNRNEGKYCPTESYTGKYDLVAQLTYGTFESSTNNFYQTGSTLHVRIPWSMLNFTDPSEKLVISDTRTDEAIAKDAYGLQTQSTSGILFSLIIADKETKDTLYAFPLNKQANGYKTFTWDSWDTPAYTFRNKESFDILSRYFSSVS